MGEASAQQEPETIAASEVAELVQPLPDVSPAAVEAGREQEAEAQAQDQQPHAPAPATAPAAAPLPASAAAPPPPPAAAKPRGRVAVTDEKGRPFNPLLHECTDDGQPIMRSAPNDRFVRCRRQPLKEWKRASVLGDEAPPQAAPVEVAPTVDTAKQMAAAATMCGLQLMCMRVALGDKVGQSDAEREELTNSWLSVFQHYGVGGSFHPVVGLALVSGSIVVGALHHEDTRSRLTRIWHWTQRKALGAWQWVRGNRKAKPQQAEQPEKAKGEPARQPEREAA